MITSWLEAHTAIYWVAWALYAILELVIGEKKPLGAPSSLRLVWEVLARTFLKEKPKGALVTTTNPNAITVSVVVDGPVYTAGGTILESTQKILAGEKPQQVITEELGPVMAQLSTLGMIPADFTGDRASVLRAAALRAIDVEEAIRISKIPLVSAPAPAK